MLIICSSLFFHLPIPLTAQAAVLLHEESIFIMSTILYSRWQLGFKLLKYSPHQLCHAKVGYLLSWCPPPPPETPVPGSTYCMYISFQPTEGPTPLGTGVGRGNLYNRIISNFLVLTQTTHQRHQHHLCYRDNSGPPLAPDDLIRQLNHPVRGRLCRVGSYPLDIDRAWMWSYWGE